MQPLLLLTACAFRKQLYPQLLPRLYVAPSSREHVTHSESDATRKENRTLVYAVNSASGVLGFILGPGTALSLAEHA